MIYPVDPHPATATEPQYPGVYRPHDHHCPQLPGELNFWKISCARQQINGGCKKRKCPAAIPVNTQNQAKSKGEDEKKPQTCSCGAESLSPGQCRQRRQQHPVCLKCAIKFSKKRKAERERKNWLIRASEKRKKQEAEERRKMEEKREKLKAELAEMDKLLGGSDGHSKIA